MSPTPPRTVAVVGAGIVGLASAWFLQEHGVEVTVLERDRVGAGASWGNSGWLSPALATPLPEPAVVRYGARSALRASSPVYVPPRPDPKVLGFLARFLLSSTSARWRAGMAGMAPLNALALDSFDRLIAGGVTGTTSCPPAHLACFRHRAEQLAMAHELDEIRACGQPVDAELLDGDGARALNPAVSEEVTAALALKGQRFLDPSAFVTSLAEAVAARGGHLETGTDVKAVREVNDRAELAVLQDELLTRRAFDAIVLANGAWLGELTRRLGVRVPVQSGRGYSFTAPTSRRGDHSPVLPHPARRLHAGRRPRARGRDDGASTAGRTHRSGPAGSRRRLRPPAPCGCGSQRHPRCLGGVTAVHRRRAPAHRSNAVEPDLGGRGSRDVGRHPGTGHGQPGRGGHGDRGRTSGAAPLRPAPLASRAPDLRIT